MIKNAAFVSDKRNELYCSMCKAVISTCKVCGKKFKLRNQIICHALQMHLCSKECETKQRKIENVVAILIGMIFASILGYLVYSLVL